MRRLPGPQPAPHRSRLRPHAETPTGSTGTTRRADAKALASITTPAPLAANAGLAAAFDILGQRWNGLILHTLATRPARFGELRTAIGSISTRLLGGRGRTGRCGARPRRGRRLLQRLDAQRGQSLLLLGRSRGQMAGCFCCGSHCPMSRRP
ncbi:winged helix-turn-helix transcriptional regulator [Streptomyces sp. NPDC053069]|uniref:winged helix-turn-helix transcriptional regulator n=1 Tax=Streptomyces sp. NPDC053069 TaxID=3365695 RepID=UPI0037D8E4F8